MPSVSTNAPQPSQPSTQVQYPTLSTEVIETPPTPLNQVSPVAPRIANKNFLPLSLRNSEIHVTLKVFVDTRGTALKAIIVKGVPNATAYDDSAREAALASTYNPGTRNGKPSTSWCTIDYNFGKPR